MAVNWDEINRCPIWKVLGVTECDNCPTCAKCWGDESVLPISALVEPEGFGERDFFAEADNEQANDEVGASNGSISTQKEV